MNVQIINTEFETSNSILKIRKIQISKKNPVFLQLEVPFFREKNKSNRIQLVCFDPKVNLKAAVSIFLLEDALFQSVTDRPLFVFSKLS